MIQSLIHEKFDSLIKTLPDFELKENHTILSKAVNELDSEIQYLKDEIHKLNVSPEYARKILRDKYHITDENEEIVFFAN